MCNLGCCQYGLRDQLLVYSDVMLELELGV